MSMRLLSPCNGPSGEGNPSWAGCERDFEWDSGPAAQAWPSHRGVTFWHGTTLGWVFFHPAADCRVFWSSLHPTPPLPRWFQNLLVHPALGSLCRITEPAPVGTQVTRSRAENERRQQEPWRVMKKGSARSTHLATGDVGWHTLGPAWTLTRTLTGDVKYLSAPHSSRSTKASRIILQMSSAWYPSTAAGQKCQKVSPQQLHSRGTHKWLSQTLMFFFLTAIKDTMGSGHSNKLLLCVKIPRYNYI